MNTGMNGERATAMGLIGCETCGLVVQAPRRPQQHAGFCPRCHAALHVRKPDSLTRCWAYLIAAAILYVPANLLPVLRTTQGFDRSSDTILSGVVALWNAGSWDLAVIVFTASIVVPLLKIGTMMMLLITTQAGSTAHRAERTRLYRIMEFVGHWSMLDVFAVALLVALVHFGPLAQVQPGGGIIAFGAVVVLTMLSTMSFDPRLIWDAVPSTNAASVPAKDSGRNE
jgi:paraquat-inducible protein A